jgi:hypothetical protein
VALKCWDAQLLLQHGSLTAQRGDNARELRMAPREVPATLNFVALPVLRGAAPAPRCTVRPTWQQPALGEVDAAALLLAGAGLAQSSEKPPRLLLDVRKRQCMQSTQRRGLGEAAFAWLQQPWLHQSSQGQPPAREQQAVAAPLLSLPLPILQASRPTQQQAPLRRFPLMLQQQQQHQQAVATGAGSEQQRLPPSGTAVAAAPPQRNQLRTRGSNENAAAGPGVVCLETDASGRQRVYQLRSGVDSGSGAAWEGFDMVCFSVCVDVCALFVCEYRRACCTTTPHSTALHHIICHIRHSTCVCATAACLHPPSLPHGLLSAWCCLPV